MSKLSSSEILFSIASSATDAKPAFTVEENKIAPNKFLLI